MDRMHRSLRSMRALRDKVVPNTFGPQGRDMSSEPVSDRGLQDRANCWPTGVSLVAAKSGTSIPDRTGFHFSPNL
jgi:hypothetical protein